MRQARQPVAVVAGVIMYRWNINLSGFLVVVSYLPGETTVA